MSSWLFSTLKVYAASPRSRQLIPLAILLVILAGATWLGYQIWISVGKFQDAASQRMEKKNVVFTKDGVRVGIKHVATEKYVDQTQSWVVKAWNLGGGKIENK